MTAAVLFLSILAAGSVGEAVAQKRVDHCEDTPVADYEPPDNLSEDKVEMFIIGYHEAYVLNEEFSPTHKGDFVNGEVTSIDSYEY